MPKKTKILFAINCMNIGGAPSVVFAQMKFLDKEKFEPHLLMLYPSKEANFLKQVDFLPVEHIVQFRLRNRSVFDFRTLWKIFRYLRREHFDVVYTHLFLANFLVRGLAILAQVPVILAFEHSTYFNKSHWQIVADRILAKWTNRIVASTKEVADFTSKQEHVRRDRFAVVRNPVSIPKRSSVDVDELWELSGFEPSGVLFLTIGRFSEEKGQHILLEAAERAHQEHPTARFLIVGHGPLESALQATVAEKKMGEYCHILREPARAKEFLYIADWFVLPSLREGQSIVVEEAMLAGLPVVASNLEGMGGIIEEGRNGFLAEAGNIASLESALLRAICTGDDRQKFSDEVRSVAEKQFKPIERVRELERLFSMFSSSQNKA